MPPTRWPNQYRPDSQIDVLIKAALIGILAISCYLVFGAFRDLLLWSLFLAVMLYPLHRRLRPRLGNYDGLTSTLIVVLSLVVLIGPTYLLTAALVDSVQHALAALRSDIAPIPPAPDWLAGWPRLHALWQQAAADEGGTLRTLVPQVRQFALGLLGRIAGVGTAFLLLVAALVVAGIMMAYGEQGHRAMRRIASRIVGPAEGDDIVHLCTATIRTVALGVIGIAFIQMLLVGVGFVFMGVPGAGLLALAVLVLGVAQVPAIVLVGPVIAYVFVSEGANLTTIVFAVYSIVAGLADNVLKPLLLGRGVDVPMPVVLIGALGGLVVQGIIGLFIGPIVLALGYRLFWEWVDGTTSTTTTTSGATREPDSP